MQIHESAEDYLESILVIGQQKGSVRSIDVAQYMGFSKPSVSRAVGLLRENGYLTVDSSGFLKLTKSGLEIADRIYERHQFFQLKMFDSGVRRLFCGADAHHMMSFSALRAQYVAAVYAVLPF